MREGHDGDALASNSKEREIVYYVNESTKGTLQRRTERSGLKMAARCILILGGARSGKSSLAQNMAKGLGSRVLFVATGAPLDEEMRARIQEHKRNRPRDWLTLETGADVGDKIMTHVGDAEVVVIDCITLLVSNILLIGEDGEEAGADQIDYASAEARVVNEVRSLIRCVDSARATFIVVSNEVGMGLVPPYPSGRLYRDLLGKANQLLAQRADDVYLMIAGIPWQLKRNG